MCDSDEVKGIIIPDLVDDVAKDILYLVGIEDLFELRMVSKVWLSFYNTFKPTEIISTLHPYFSDFDFVSDNNYRKYKPIVEKIINKSINTDNGIDINKDDYKIISRKLADKKNYDVYTWIRSMISHYIKNGDINNLHKLIVIYDYYIDYYSTWYDSTILIQALETDNEMMIKYSSIT